MRHSVATAVKFPRSVVGQAHAAEIGPVFIRASAKQRESGKDFILILNFYSFILHWLLINKRNVCRL